MKPSWWFLFLCFLQADIAHAQLPASIGIYLAVYSGSRDPGWIVSDANQLAQLQSFIAGLPVSTPADPPPIRALAPSTRFVLVPIGGAVSGFPNAVQVYNSVIRVENADNTIQYFQDTKGLASFLISQATRQGICANFDRQTTIVINGCDSGVNNRLLDNGCTFNDKVMQCRQAALSQADFINCVSGLTGPLQQVGAISADQQASIQSCAAATATSPVTVATLSPLPDADGSNNSAVTVTLTSTDQSGKGVKQIKFAATGAETRIGVVPGNSATVVITAEGTTTIQFSATDNAGNTESPKSVTVKIRRTPP